MSQIRINGRMVTGEKIPFAIRETTTVAQLKTDIKLTISVPYEEIYLFYQGILMDDSRLLFMVMEDGDFFHILTSLQD